MPDYWHDGPMLDPSGYHLEEKTVCESVRCGLERWECRCECPGGADDECDEYDFYDPDSDFAAFGICEGQVCYYDAECVNGCP